MTLSQPYFGPGSLILTVTVVSILRSGAFEDHGYEVAFPAPANPVRFLAHTVSPHRVFRGVVKSSRKVSLAGHGVPADAEGVFAVVETSYPRTKTLPAQTTTDAEMVKGTSIRVRTGRPAAVTVSVTGWVDRHSSPGGQLSNRTFPQRVTRPSAALAHVPSDATAVIVSVSSPKPSIVGGVPVAGYPSGMILPLTNGHLSVKLSRGAVVTVQGYLAPPQVSDLGQISYIS